MVNHRPTPISWNRLVNLVRRRAGPVVDAEDLVQEAYIRLAEFSLSNSVRSPEAFVLQTATNLGRSEHRARIRHDKAHSDSAVAAILHPQIVSQHEEIAARERLRVVEQAMAELPARAREVFVLHRIEGLKYREVAELLNISVSAVEKNMARALAHMALKLHEFGEERGKRG
jgi:RNA polymerase sigma factor (sigma-70 family)